MQGLCVLHEQLIRHVGHIALRLHGLLGVVQRQSQHHLVLPEGDGVDDRGADLLGHQAVVILHHADLRCHLHGDGARQLKVVYLLLEAAYEVCEIVRGLRVFGKPRLLGLRDVLGQLDIAQVLYLELTGEDVHGELLHVLLVLLVHLIHHADVLHQRDLVLFELLDYLVDIDLSLVKLRLLLGNGLGSFLEQTEEALLFLLVEVQTLELDNKLAEHVAALTEILGLDAAQSGVGELGDILLCGTAVVHDLIGVLDVYLL